MTQIDTTTEPIDERTLTRAVEALKSGELVVFPTETVYGLGADAAQDGAVARIFAAKNRPDFNPLIVHVASLEDAARFGIFSNAARALAEAFWPGPLSLVVPRTPDCPASLLVSAGLDTIALRVPGSPIAQELLKRSGLGIAAPSANPSGALSPTDAAHIVPSIREAAALVIDGGPCRVGLESTIVGFDGDRPVLLRPGGISIEDLEKVAGPVVKAANDPNAPTSPGQLLSHYAPHARVRLDATEVRDDEALLRFGASDIPQGRAKAEKNLSATGDLVEAASHLFQYLRDLDASGADAIAVEPIPLRGLGLALNDRLARAAAPREGASS
ncbi:MAG: threonylcarbamoyl-AMP synthase [Alphaproteobacteria bacterium]|nr:MAG: threonylcarbamoyl-AMP synthase [Alphaproteobacteria bacterium]